MKSKRTKNSYERMFGDRLGKALSFAHSSVIKYREILDKDDEYSNDKKTHILYSFLEEVMCDETAQDFILKSIRETPYLMEKFNKL